MLLRIISIIANVIYFVILNISFYTDRAMMPDGNMRTWHRSPISRLYIADDVWLLYLQLFFASVSIVTAILMMLGVKGGIVRNVWLISTIASAVMFIIILIVTANSHAKYA
ncbi:MAG: hypothetical protein IKE38_05965 [Erysipelotrichaceae bacterium]|nr:hypothetical protein [Erysipelotrichaceae bacterium]